jgi:hypothetical protein
LNYPECALNNQQKSFSLEGITTVETKNARIDSGFFYSLTFKKEIKQLTIQ